MRYVRAAVSTLVQLLLVVGAAFLVIPLLLRSGAPLTAEGIGGWTVVVIAVGLIAGIVVHEAAHALAASLVGFRVAGVVVGSGPRALTGTWGRATWQLRLVPMGGATFMTTSDPRRFRSRHLLAIGAGPVATAAVVGALLLWEPASSQLAWGRAVLVVFETLAVLANLTPGPAGRGGIRTDGGQIVDVLRDPSGTFARQDVGTELLSAIVRMDAGDAAGAAAALDGAQDAPRDALQAAWAADVRLAAGDVECGRRVALEGLSRLSGDDEPETVALLQNAAAYAALCRDDRSLAAEAERLSASAHAVLPDHAAVLDTRGWALVEAGRPAEGRPLLERAASSGVRGENALAVRAHLLCAALAESDLLRARHLAERLPWTGDPDPSVRIALGRYRAVVDALTDEQRTFLLTGPTHPFPPS